MIRNFFTKIDISDTSAKKIFQDHAEVDKNQVVKTEGRW